MSITNTSADTTSIALAAMLGAPGIIEAQEAKGQRELVRYTELPTRFHNRADFERLGFTFGAPVEGDSLFLKVTIPPGWTSQGSVRVKWYYLVDDSGRRRVSVYYRSTRDDRDAHMSLIQRYGIERDYDAPDDVSVRVKDHDGTVIWESERITTPEWQRRWDIYTGLVMQAHEWLDANRPAWRDIVAAWDE
jgi:hypothetical protein